jgi:hypothetical protein
LSSSKRNPAGKKVRSETQQIRARDWKIKMGANRFNWKLVAIAVVLFLGVLFVAPTMVAYINTQSAGFDAETSPTPYPTASPIVEVDVSPPPPSDLIEAAIEYTAQNKEVNPAELQVSSWEYITYPYLDRQFLVVNLVSSIPDGGTIALVDTEDKSVHEVGEVETADNLARFEKYGKLEPALAETLPNLEATETIDVGIWVQAELQREESELYGLLAEQYPEVKKAMEEEGYPFALGDYQLIMEVRRAYLEMRAEEYRVLVAPLVEYLQEKGIAYEHMERSPLVIVNLNEDQIREIAAHESVGRIYLAEMQLIVEEE